MGEAFICRRGGGSIGNKSILYVTIDAGSVVTCTKGNTVKTKIATDGTCKFTGLDTGTWTIKGTKDGIETSTNVAFDKQEVKYITLGYFTATIVTTFPTDCTSVTCKKDAVTLSVPSGELPKGSYTFSVHEAGEWTVTAENESSSKSETVNITESRAYTVDIKFTLVLYDSGSEYPESTGEWSVTSSSGEYADNCEITKNSSNMVFFAGYHSTASFSHSQPIDMSKYATLHILGKFDNKSTGESGTVGVSTSNSGAGFNAYVTMSGIDSAVIQRDIDISEIMSSAYFKVYMTNVCDFTISKIWLD